MEGDRKNVHIVMCTLVCKCLQSANATANSSHTMQPIQSYHELSHSPTLSGFTCVCVCVHILRICWVSTDGEQDNSPATGGSIDPQLSHD